MTTSPDILAEAHRRAGRLGEAEQCYRQVLAADPTSAHAHNQLGIVLAQQRRIDEAIACFQEALRISPNSAAVVENLRMALAQKCYASGVVALGADRFADAASCFRQAIDLSPDAESHNNLGVALLLMGQLEKAEREFNRAIKLREDYADAHSNLAGVLEMQGALSADSVARSVASLRRAVHLRPDCAKFRMNLGFALLRCGNFEEGWREFEWRTHVAGVPRARFSQPAWSGSAIAGKTILLCEDEGFGDSLQCVRYAELVKARGARVIVECRRELAGLLANCPAIEGVIVTGTPLPAFDEHAPLLSLPRVMGTVLANIPAKVPYVFPAAGLVEKWRKELRGGPGLKIGIGWQGNPSLASDRFRSIPLAQFAPLAGVEGVHFYSLQTGVGREQLAAAIPGMQIVDLADRIGDFQDTAAIMCNLDLVITSDTARAHLAGALGVPVWVALAYVADWRWLLERSDNPWYPTMRLYRQRRPGDWPDVFRRIANDLAELRA